MSVSTHGVLSTPINALADEGSYFNAVNASPGGAGIAQNITTSFTATDGLLSISLPASSTKRLFMDYVRLIWTVVPASATSTQALVAVDSIIRLSSGGTALTAKGANMALTSPTSAATVTFGALTLAAESGNVRRIARSCLRSAIPVALDEAILSFTSIDSPGAAGITGGTTALRSVIPVGPAVIGPGQSVNLHVWNPANAATPPSYEVEIGWWER